MNLRRWKVFKIILLDVLILPFAAYAIAQGGDPTLLGGFALVVIALLNGIEIGEFISAWESVRRVQAEEGQSDSTPDDSRSDQR